MHDLTADAPSMFVLREQPEALRSTGHLALLRQHSTASRQGVISSALIGRCKGRGTRVFGRHIVRGKTFLVGDTQVGDRQFVPQIEEGDIVVAATLPAHWASALLAAGGLVIDVVDTTSQARGFALRHGIPLISNIPHAGQFVHGELIYLLGDGRVIVAQ